MAGDPKNANKPEAVKIKMIEGKMKKYYKENCLVDQEFVKDSELSVAQYTAKVAKGIDFDRRLYIVRRVFAAEVASMVK